MGQSPMGQRAPPLAFQRCSSRRPHPLVEEARAGDSVTSLRLSLVGWPRMSEARAWSDGRGVRRGLTRQLLALRAWALRAWALRV